MTKTFGRVRAVAGLDLRVDAVDVFGFLGPNGPGRPPRSGCCSPCTGRPAGARPCSAGLRRGQHRDPPPNQVTFRHPVDPAMFAGLAGATVTVSDGLRLELEVTPPIGPLLRLLADHDPADLTSRRVGLDESFLGLYRESPAPEASHAR